MKSTLSRSSDASEVEFPAAASIALRPILFGDPIRGAVLGSGHSVVWIDLGSECLVLDAGRNGCLPNGLRVAGTSPPWTTPTSALIGDGRVKLDGAAHLVPCRWWDPVPRLGAVHRDRLSRCLEVAGEGLPDSATPDLESALSARDAPGLLDAADRLMGRGEGLTPMSDDFLAGAFSGYLLFARALGDAEAASVVTATRRSLIELARSRTTSLSASLLHHALWGRVAGSAAAFLTALAGRGEVLDARRSLLQIGHTSGLGLVSGIITGVRAVTRGPA